QQAKWIILSSAIVFLWQFALNVLIALSPPLSQPGALAQVAIQLLTPVIFVLVPLSLGVAILRYRLWDIDTLINKALVYGSLSALLGALYAGLIVGLESLVGFFSGTAAQNPVVLVVSTLVIAALFLPARRRIQAIIDRRFYRKKYDAEQTLVAFCAS